MKYLLASIGCFAAIIAGCMINIHYMDKNAGEIAKNIDAAIEAVKNDDIEAAESSMDEVNELWKSNVPYFSSVTTHSQINSMYDMLNECVGDLKYGKYDDFLVSSEILHDQVTKLTDIEKLKWENIL